MRSKRLKYILFCNATGAYPVFPTKPANLMRFVLWLPANGIRSGWRSASQYTSEVCSWNKQLGFPDPKAGIEFHWKLLKLNFERLILAEHPSVKLPMRPPMLEAMALDADLIKDDDLRDIACYYLLFFAGFRIGHCAATSPQATEHTLRFEDLYFHPSFVACEQVLVCVRSTKTRLRASGLPFWMPISRQSQLSFCPVALIKAHYLGSYRGNPGDFLFRGAKGGALPRTTFTSTLRRRLTMSQPRLSVTFDISKFSGVVSVRKGSLSTLGAPPRRPRRSC